MSNNYSDRPFVVNASAVDLFCGVGGLTYGFQQEGIAVNAGIDIDPDCRYSYEQNNKCEFLLKDVSELSGDDIAGLYTKNDLKILVGCAPCQPFSAYTQGYENRNDAKWGLLYSFSRIISELKPEIVSMENVSLLTKHQVYEDFIEGLIKEGYHVTTFIVDCREYGIPQTRRRLVLFASLFGSLDLIEPTHKPTEYTTVRDWIKDLEPLSAGEISSIDPLHRSRNLSDKNLRRIRQSKPGGTWRQWSEDLIADCHKKPTCRTYVSVYGRMEWDKPAPTITTQFFGFGNGRFGHPEQDRAISLREGALLQTFPIEYDFIESGKQISTERIGKLIGNAVPVKLGKVIARSIKNHVREYNV